MAGALACLFDWKKKVKVNKNASKSMEKNGFLGRKS